MKKRKLLLGLALMMTFGVGYSVQQNNSISWIKTLYAAQAPYTWTAVSGDQSKFNNKTGTATLGSIAWNYTRLDDTYEGFANSSIQLGSKAAPDGLTLVSPSQQNIKSITVNADSYDASSKCTIKIGDTEYVSAIATGKPGDLKAIGGSTLPTPLNGAISISFTKSSRAFYLNSISIVYADTQVPETNYSIEYDLDGGTNNEGNPSSYPKDSTLTLLEPTKRGFNFLGWKIKGGNDSYISEIPAGQDENISLLACWEKVAITEDYRMGDMTEKEEIRIVGKVMTKFNDSEIYILNGHNNMRLKKTSAFSEFNVGDTLDVFGTYSTDNNGIGQLTNFAYCEKTEIAATDPTPITDPANVNSSHLYEYVSLRGLQLKNDFSNSTQIIGHDEFILYYNNQKMVSGYSASAYTAGKYVQVTGVIIQHNTTIEVLLSSIGLENTFTVFFDTDEGSVVEAQEVLENGKVTRPEDPIKGEDVNYIYTFENWYTDSNCNDDDFVGTPFDFENTIIDGDITLYARYTKTKNTSAIDKINTFETKNGLSYKYTSTVTKTEETNISFTASEHYSEDQTISSIAFNNDLTATLSKGSNSNSPKYYNNGTSIRVYVGNTITFNSASGNIKSIAFTTSQGSASSFTPTKGEFDDNTLILDNSSVTLTNDSNGQIRISGIQITYEAQAKSFTYSNVAIRYGGLISKDYWTAINTQGRVTDYGVMLLKDSTLQGYHEADNTITTVADAFKKEKSVTKKSITEELGGVNVPKELNETHYLFNVKISFANDSLFNTVFHAQAYMVVDGQYYFFKEANEGKGYSVKSLAQDYIDRDDLGVEYDENSFEGSLYALAHYGE